MRNFSLPGILLALGGLLLMAGCSRSKNPDQYLSSAQSFYESRELEKAKLEYFNVMRLQPTNGVAISQLGKIFFRQGQLREAYPFLREARRLQPADLELARYLATIYVAAGQFDKARTEALSVLEQNPADEEALITLAESSRTAEDIEKALQQIGQFQPKAGNKAAFHIARAQLAQRSREPAQAEAELQKALTLEPQSIHGQIILGMIRWSEGATNQAEQAFRSAATAAPPESPAQVRLATFLLRTGRLDEAKQILEKVTRDAPERTGVWTLRGEIALAEKKLPEAGQLIDRALSQAPGDFEARSLQAQLRLAENKPADAVKILKDLADDRPRFGPIHYDLAVAHLLNRELPAAITALEKAISVDANQVNAILLLGELNIARGQASLALAPLQDLARRAPRLARAHLLLARAYAATGRADDALGVYRSMRQQFPEEASVPYQMGLLLRQRQQPDAARQAFEEARRLMPQDLSSLEQLVDLEITARAPDRALALLQPALDQAPSAARLWLLRARVYALQQDRPGAEKSLEKAIELEPDLQPAYLMLSELYLKTGDPKASLSHLDALLDRQPKNVSALGLKGMIHTQLKEYPAAQKAYEQVLEINPNFVLALNNLAHLLSEQSGKLDQAHAMATKARQLAPQDPAVADTLGWIEYRRQNYPEALRLLQEAAGKLPGQAEVEYHVGMASYMMGDEINARRALTAALKDNVPFTDREVAVQRLAILNAGADANDGASLVALERRHREDPKDLIAAIRLAQALESAGQNDRARDAYNAVLQLNPSTLLAVTRLAALEADRDVKRANELARQAQQLAPNDPAVLHTLGRVALRSGQTASAYGLLQSTTRRITNEPAIWLDFATAAFGTGRFAESEDAARRVLALGGPASGIESAQAFLDMGALARDPKAGAEAQARIQQVLARDPQHAPALYAQALVLERTGKPAEARVVHDRLLERYPDFTPSTRQLALLYALSLNDETKAYELATRARTVYPKDEMLAHALGRLAYKRGDTRYAVQLFQEVSRAQPQNADLQYELGLALLQLKNLPEARAALERAIALAPEAAFVPEARKLLTAPPPG